MQTLRKMLNIGVTAGLLLSGLTANAQAYFPYWGNIARPGVTQIQIKGNVICTACNFDEVRKTQTDQYGLYQFTSKQGPLVIRVNWTSNPLRWHRVVWTHQVWMRGADDLLQKLQATENGRKEIEIIGLLSETRTLDVAGVVVKGGME